jgi:hypothetical protein
LAQLERRLGLALVEQLVLAQVPDLALELLQQPQHLLLDLVLVQPSVPRQDSVQQQDLQVPVVYSYIALNKYILVSIAKKWQRSNK